MSVKSYKNAPLLSAALAAAVALTACASNADSGKTADRLTPEAASALENVIKEGASTEGLTQEQIDRGCVVWDRKGPLAEGDAKANKTDTQDKQIVCPEVDPQSPASDMR